MGWRKLWITRLRVEGEDDDTSKDKNDALRET